MFKKFNDISGNDMNNCFGIVPNLAIFCQTLAH